MVNVISKYIIGNFYIIFQQIIVDLWGRWGCVPYTRARLSLIIVRNTIFLQFKHWKLCTFFERETKDDER